MIIGIGTDIVEHDLTKVLNWTRNLAIQKRVFSEKELNIHSSKNNHDFLSGRFAAKEAILKCLGTGMRDGIALTDIQILQSESGKPTIELSGEVKKLADAQKIISWHISISHSIHYSTAFVIAES